MLVKAEIKEVPLCECPTFSEKELPAADALLAASTVCDLPRSGKIIIVDYYNPKTRKLQGRFISDGNKYITYLPDDNQWSANAPERLLNATESISTQKTLEMICDFLNVRYYGERADHFSQVLDYQYVYGPLALCAKFAAHRRYEKSRKRADSRYERMCRHLNMFPEKYPKEVYDFLEQRAFPGTYIFYSKLNRELQRTGRCASCGKTFSVPPDVKHNSQTTCPKCGRQATYCADWLGTKVVEKALLCYPMQKEGQLLLEFSKVERTVFRGAKSPSYDINAFACCLYLNEKGKQKIYSYGIGGAFYYNHDWCDWGHMPIYRKAYVYPENLKDIFGEKYYNVCIPEIIGQVTRPIDFARLLDNLKGFPQTEYLCKSGMTVFASDLDRSYFLDPAATNIFDALGVHKQDMPLYKKYSITPDEHRVLLSIKGSLNEETVEILRLLRIKTNCADSCLTDLLKRMTINKLFNYVSKQVSCGIGSEHRIVRWMEDFYIMSEEIGVKLNRKNMFPTNIKRAHDELSERITALRKDLEEQASKTAHEIINNYFDGYGRDGFMVVVPKDREDFVREGQELSHCVGSQPQYYNDHVAGTKMIFFIRAVSAPNIALYTAQIDMLKMKVIQCYGYGDKPAPAPVKQFINRFAEWLKKQKSKQVMQEAG